MISPPEPEALVLLKAALNYPLHLVKIIPALHHSTAWLNMVASMEGAVKALQADYDKHRSDVNDAT